MSKGLEQLHLKRGNQVAKTYEKVLLSVDKTTHLIHSEIPVIYQIGSFSTPRYIP